MKKISLNSIILFLISSMLFSQNNSLDFDGTDDYVEITSSPEFTPNQFTIEAWIKSDAGGSLQSIFTKYNTNIDMISYGLVVLEDNTIQFGVYEEFSPTLKYRVIITDDPVLTPNVWQHIAATFDLTTQALKIYVDGTESPSTLDPGSIVLTSIFNGSQSVLIGNLISLNGSGRFFNGRIDEVRFWNTERTQSDISDNMNTELSGTESGLVAYYKMDNSNSGCDVEDCNDNENHGTRIGENGSNNLPQFSDDVPSLTDVDCEASISCDPLPVDLIQFKGEEVLNQINLEWATLNEVNNLGFEIQKSYNGLDWEKIAFVKKTESSTDTHRYYFSDFKPLQGLNYYRLIQIDIDGSENYSNTINIEYSNDKPGWRLYPNPVTDIISIGGMEAGEYKIRDNAGRLLKQDVFINAQLNLSFLPKGIYYIEFNSGFKVFVKQIIKI